MFAVFCLRLACGLLGCLPLLPAAQVNPRFYRTHFLTALGLCVLALVLLHQTAAPALWAALLAAVVLTFGGAVVWRLEGAPGGRVLLALALAAALAALALTSADHPVVARSPDRAAAALPWLWADDVASAALLGSATT